MLAVEDSIVTINYVDSLRKVIDCLVIIVEVRNQSTVYAVVFHTVVFVPAMVNEFFSAAVIALQPRLSNVFIFDACIVRGIDEDEVPAIFTEEDARNHVLVVIVRDRKSVRHCIFLFVVSCCILII